MATKQLFGRSGLARFLGISDRRVGDVAPPPDALVDGRPAWLPETAARLKVEREARRAKRQALRGRYPRVRAEVSA